MTTEVAVFYCEPIARVRRSLRRYARGATPCPRMSGAYSYHDASVLLDEIDAPLNATPVTGSGRGVVEPDDPRWPEACACGYRFGRGDERQLFIVRMGRRSDTGAELPMRDFPVGAVWSAEWENEIRRRTADGRSLWVQTPGGPWGIDGRAQNCTMPGDETHFCWVRHGRPEDGTLHVDKNGPTCAAGAGSIVAGTYHGFLHHGRLTDCP